MREIDQIVGLRSKLGFPLLGNPHRPIPHPMDLGLAARSRLQGADRQSLSRFLRASQCGAKNGSHRTRLMRQSQTGLLPAHLATLSTILRGCSGSRRGGRRSGLRAAPGLGVDFLCDFGFPAFRVRVEVFFSFRFTPGLALYSCSFFSCWRRAQPCRTSFPSCRNSSMIRLSASAAFSISPPAFSIMPSSVSILAFSSGYSFSLSSKVALLGTELFSISEKRSAMGFSLRWIYPY